MHTTSIAVFLRRFARDTRGATIIEFALVVVPFFILFFGVIEFGLYMFTWASMENLVARAGRISAVATSGTRAAAVDLYLTEHAKNLIQGSKAVVTSNVVSAGGASTPDVCLDANGSTSTGNICASGKYIDVNNNGVYDGVSNPNNGGNGELVEIRLTLPWKIMMPMIGDLIAPRGVLVLSTSTTVTNEPI